MGKKQSIKKKNDVVSSDLTLTESRVLGKHKDIIWDIAVTPDGKKAVSASQDNTLKVWDLESGQCLSTLEGHSDWVGGTAITPDGGKIVSGSNDKTMRVWDMETGKNIATFTIGEHIWEQGVAVRPDGKNVVLGLWGDTVEVRSLGTGQKLAAFKGHTSHVEGVAITPDGRRVVSGSWDNTLKVWNMETGQCLNTFEGHTGYVNGVAITPNGRRVVSGSWDNTLKVWDLETGQCLATFEGHTSHVNGEAILPNGRQVVSASSDNTMKVWDLESGRCLATFKSHIGGVTAVALTPDGRWVVSGDSIGEIRVWEMPEFDGEMEDADLARYTNAKVVLVGESGVGKTGLALRLAENRWEATESTHGMSVWQLELPQQAETAKMEREVWLWDFAGQPDYRLIHQLFMDETALALLVFDPQRDNPFESLGHWEKALAAAVKYNPARLLVAGRCDRGGVTVSKNKLEQYFKARGYSAFLDTAAKTGGGCDALRAAINDNIPWERLPWTATTKLFKTLKDAIIQIKDEDVVLVRIADLRLRLQSELKEDIPEDKLRAVVGLLAGQGIVQKLDFGDFVLLQPEQINNYASAVVRCVRENIDEIGAICERDVLEANFDFKGMKRLNPEDEKILLRAMVQTFIDRSLCLREDTTAGTQLVFPYYFKQDRPEIEDFPNVCVTYGFAGLPEEVYTTLVVRLHYTNDFDKAELWKDAADFLSLGGKRVGLQMSKKDDDSAEIKVYFEAEVPVDTQVSFIKYIHEHLQKRAKEVTRVRSYVCPHCDTPLENRRAIKKRLEIGKKDILCGLCEKRVTLIDLIEEKFASDKFLRLVQDMDRQAQINLDNESRELILVGHAFSTAGEAGQIFRPTANSDWGIDGEIEFKNRRGKASGQRVYLQLKHGDSYLYNRKRDDKEIFTIKNARHAEYWQSHQYPVMLVIRTSDGRIRWMNVTDYLKKQKGETKQIVFEGEPFTAASLLKMRDQLLG